MEVVGRRHWTQHLLYSLAERKRSFEKIPWVESASVMRFVRSAWWWKFMSDSDCVRAVGPRISLIDAGGTLMELPDRASRIFVSGDPGNESGRAALHRGRRE